MNDDSARLPDPRMIPRWTAPPPRPPQPPGETTLTDPQVGDDVDKTVVRPFFVTAGRTVPLLAGLRVHTVLMARPAALHAPLRFELRHIVELCQEPRSVAEVASALRIPVGVARILVGDLVNGGYVSCHDQNEKDLAVHIIERIVDRVRAL